MPKKIQIQIVPTTGDIPKISGDVHIVPDDLDSFSSEEAFGAGHQTGLDDLEAFRAKIAELYENWNPPEDNEIAAQYKHDLGKVLHPGEEGGCG